MNKVLIVEDDKTIAMGIEYALQKEGFDPLICGSVQDTRAALAREAFDLILLDAALPDGSGFDLCREIRGISETPVIFLTACDEEVQIILGLDLGADDYITKPFRVRELISRIYSVLRRYGKQQGAEREIRLGTLLIHPESVKVFKNGTLLHLSTLEYRLLLTLAQNRGRVLTRSQILDSLWDVAGDFVNDNTLTVYIKRLREKIEEDPQNPAIILTVRGLGYKAGGLG